MGRLFLAIAFVVSALPAAAQSPQTSADSAATGVEILPHYTFHLNAAHLSGNDPRFVWDTNFGGEVDLVGSRRARATFAANYEAVLGEVFRAFDPSQGNYILAGSLSARVASLELSAVFHHESRHLSDRAKREAVDWNMVGGRVRRDVTRGRMQVRSQVDVRGVVEKSFVDYRWEAAGDAHLRYRLRPGVSAIAAAGVQSLGTDGTRGRGTQSGVKGEGGVRLNGRGGAVELYVAGERRVDPYPLASGTATWVMAGFRLLSLD